MSNICQWEKIGGGLREGRHSEKGQVPFLDRSPASEPSSWPFSLPCCGRWGRTSRCVAGQEGVSNHQSSLRRSARHCEGCYHGYGHLQLAPNWTKDSQDTWDRVKEPAEQRQINFFVFWPQFRKVRAETKAELCHECLLSSMSIHHNSTDCWEGVSNDWKLVIWELKHERTGTTDKCDVFITALPFGLCAAPRTLLLNES